MDRWAALLRGVNVGGRRRVPMADLRALLQDLGHTGGATLLQSGNAVFTARASGLGEQELRAELEAALADRFGFAVEAVLRDAAALRAAVGANPLPVGDPARFLVSFLSGPPAPGALDGIAPSAGSEQMAVGHRELYFALPDGLRNAALPARAERALAGTVTTSRNWRTVLRLLDLTGQ